jgi:arylsulfatase A-like enzyme/cytochrome c-type biogenesis protein CcmH/NrfG
VWGDRRLLVAVCCLSGCVARQPATTPPPLPRHVLVITIDTLRADRLGCYGNREVATPNMDRLAHEGAMALEASVQVPMTRPSHVSILTGLYPAQHGIRDNISTALAADVPTLAEAFKAAGFRTAGFVSSIVLSRQSGLARGFDEYSDRFDAGADDARFLDTLRKRGDIVTAEAIAWLGQHANDRTFMWVHLYDPHDPYEPPEPYASQYSQRPYDGAVAWTDELIGRLDGAVKRLDTQDRTLVVLTSDHGEGLGEHEEPVHGFFVYQTTLRVPLIARGPGIVPGTAIHAVARSVDLFPTILDLAGVSGPTAARPLPGRSLAAAMRGIARDVDEEPSFAESLTPRIHYGWSDLRSIRDGRWKFILAPKPELYDLAHDPGERRNLIAAEPARARALRAALDRHLADEGRVAVGSSRGQDAHPVPAELRERLGALGYVDAGGGADRPESGADPKDKIGEYKVLNRLLREGIITLREEDYRGSAERFRALAAHGVDSFESHYYYGRALVGLRRWRDAAAQFERAIPHLPAFAPSYLLLADSRLAAGDRSAAIAALHQGEGVVAPDPHVYRRLAELYRDAGELQRADHYFREAIARDPSEASDWNSLGMIVGASGDFVEAERVFREAVQRDAREPRYTYNLGLTLQREHRNADAIPYFRRTLELDPRFVAARDRLAEIGSR